VVSYIHIDEKECSLFKTTFYHQSLSIAFSWKYYCTGSPQELRVCVFPAIELPRFIGDVGNSDLLLLGRPQTF
jgi:hypothetical protein